MKKKVGIIAGIAVYAVLSVAVCVGVFDSGQEAGVADKQGTETVEQVDEADAAIKQRDFSIVSNTKEYSDASQSGIYVESEDLILLEEDKQSILSRHNLPALKRMNEADAREKMANLQVLKKIETLGIDTTLFYTPEYNWKEIYNDSLTNVDRVFDKSRTVEFSGTYASELNAFLQENQDVKIEIQSDEVILDETIRVPSNVLLEGNGVVLTGESAVPYAILVEKAENVAICNMKLDGGFEQGIYVIESNRVLVLGNEITNALYKAICVMGRNKYVNLVSNSIHDNGNGAIFFDGDISRCIIQGNSVYQNRGTRNLTAGIAFSSMEIQDVYTPYNEFKDEYLYDLTSSPNNNVIKDNMIQGNYSSGFYSDGGYMNYVIDNTIEDNEKEGMCLDYGTFGTYVSGNTISRNGDRNRQTDEDLEADFILGAGRLPDGSSTAKLPAISIDNAAYNIVYNNNINENSGSGVKMVRSGYRNVILSNLITDNNAGENEAYHGFGVELGHASDPDEPVKGLDFTADYENIVARNVISGHHYSGIYMAVDNYCNDLIDNVIMDCEQFSVENFSDYFNSSVGNNTNVGTLNFEL